jgi:periplasmic divalent cation tolerance protein
MYASVLMTAPNKQSAKEIAMDLFQRRLIACANFFPCDSLFRWHGSIESAEEILVLMKIRSNDFPELIEAVKRLHPYEVPCIVKYEIASGYLPFLDWIKETTERPVGD